MFLCCWDIDRFCRGQQGLVAGRPIGTAGINEQSNDGREQIQSSNEPWPVCLPARQDYVPIPLLPLLLLHLSWWLALSHSQYWPLCSPKKRLMFSEFWGIKSLYPIIFNWSFSECGALASPTTGAVRLLQCVVWWLVFRACHWAPPSSTTPTPSAYSLNEDGAISQASHCWHSIYSEQCVDGDI